MALPLTVRGMEDTGKNAPHTGSSSSSSSSTPAMHEKTTAFPSEKTLKLLFPVLHQDLSAGQVFVQYLKTDSYDQQDAALDTLVCADASHRLKKLEESHATLRSNLNGLFTAICYMNKHQIPEPIISRLKDLQSIGSHQKLASLLCKNTYSLPEDESPLAERRKELDDGHNSSFEQPAPLLHFAALFHPDFIPELIALGAKPNQTVSHQSALRLCIELHEQPIIELIKSAGKESADLPTSLACVENRTKWLEAMIDIHKLDAQTIYGEAIEDNRGSKEDNPLVKATTFACLTRIIEEQKQQKEEAASSTFKTPAPKKKQRTDPADQKDS